MDFKVVDLKKNVKTKFKDNIYFLLLFIFLFRVCNLFCGCIIKILKDCYFKT